MFGRPPELVRETLKTARIGSGINPGDGSIQAELVREKPSVGQKMIRIGPGMLRIGPGTTRIGPGCLQKAPRNSRIDPGDAHNWSETWSGKR